MGWTDEQLSGLHEPDASFSEKERIALCFAEIMTLDAQGVSDDLFAEVRAHFDEGEVVELAAIVGLFNYFNRFNETLRMESSQ